MKLEELTKENAKDIISKMDWTENEGENILVKDTFGDTIMVIQDFQVEDLLGWYLDKLINEK